MASTFYHIAADFDGDGKGDIAGYTGTTINTIAALRNTSANSSTSFAAKLNFALPAGSAASDGENQQVKIISFSGRPYLIWSTPFFFISSCRF